VMGQPHAVGVALPTKVAEGTTHSAPSSGSASCRGSCCSPGSYPTWVLVMRTLLKWDSLQDSQEDSALRFRACVPVTALVMCGNLVYRVWPILLGV
jgi:hypothetical protein